MKIALRSAKLDLSSASPSFPLVEVLRLLWKFHALGGARGNPVLGGPASELHPDGGRRGHPVPLKRLVGVEQAPDVPVVDLVEELRIPRVFASPTNS